MKVYRSCRIFGANLNHSSFYAEMQLVRYDHLSWKRTNVACFVEFFEVQKFNFGPQCDSLVRESPQNPLNSGLGWFRNFGNFPRLC